MGNMKNMKKLCVWLMVFVCVFFSGCFKRTVRIEDYAFLQDHSKCGKIELVTFDGSYDNFKEYKQGPKFEVFLVIENHEEFFEKFNAMVCYRRLIGHHANAGKVVIKITYYNGEYEIIGANGQGYYKYEQDSEGGIEELRYQLWGLYSFDEEEFNALIQQYLNNETEGI